MPRPLPSRNVPWVDREPDTSHGTLLRAAVRLVRTEYADADHADDPTIPIEIIVRVRRPPDRG